MRILAATLSVLTIWVSSAAAAELIMVESPTCYYCKQWHAEIGHIYPKTAEAALAPLVLRDISAPEPEGTEFAAPIVFTPTFVLTDNGRELGRIEGYPGEELFWWMLSSLLTKTAEAEG